MSLDYLLIEEENSCRLVIDRSKRTVVDSLVILLKDDSSGLSQLNRSSGIPQTSFATETVVATGFSKDDNSGLS